VGRGNRSRCACCARTVDDGRTHDKTGSVLRNTKYEGAVGKGFGEEAAFEAEERDGVTARSKQKVGGT